MKRNGTWQRKSKRYRKQHPYCALCGRSVEEVHHITPVCEGGANDEDNLVGLCRECHNIVHQWYDTDADINFPLGRGLLKFIIGKDEEV